MDPATLPPTSPLDEILASIRRLPLLERLRLIERAKLEVDEDTPKPAAVAEREGKLTVDESCSAPDTATRRGASELTGHGARNRRRRNRLWKHLTPTSSYDFGCATADFADYLILESARRGGALPLHTFDERLSKTDGAKLVE